MMIVAALLIGIVIGAVIAVWWKNGENRRWYKRDRKWREKTGDWMGQ